MSQSRSWSAVESVSNVLIGYMVALVSQLVIFPIYGINVPLSTNLWIGAWFTAVLLVRSYCMRRLFNRL